MTTKYKDVILWLENKAITDPEKTEEMINHNISVVSSAFNKPYTYVDNLIRREDYSGTTSEENKIINFYFSTFRKWMR